MDQHNDEMGYSFYERSPVNYSSGSLYAVVAQSQAQFDKHYNCFTSREPWKVVRTICDLLTII